MIALCQEAANTYAQSYVGQTVDVLLETPYPDGTIDGHTDTYLTVRVKTDKPSGSVVNVHISNRKGDELYGEETQ